MKNYIVSIIMACMTISTLVGCANTQETVLETESIQQDIEEVDDADAEITSEREIKIVTTIFPEYDWVREVLGDEIEHTQLTMLIDNGVDLHSYQATADDIITVGTCDLFLYVGGESDTWVDEVLENATNPNMRVLNLMELLEDNVKEEELVEGMEASSHDHDHEEEDHDHDHDHDHEEEEEEVQGHSDEHVWLSLRNAEIIVDAIAVELGAIDAANTTVYQENAARYIEELSELDQKYQEAVEQASVQTILVADRFPYRYLVDDYQIEYYAAFAGCSAETEASFATITFLANKLDELALHTVLTTESSDCKIADTVIASTTNQDQMIRALDSMQSVTMERVEAGATYRSIMEENLAVLVEALQ